ncbi:MAG: hypothetical protein V4510_09950 [bacterium]
MAQRTGVKLLDNMLAREEWAKKKWPAICVGKIAGGLAERPLGLLAAFEVHGKAQWSRIYEPRQMTDLDEQRYKRLKAKQRALAKQMEKLKAGAFERGYPVNINTVRKITDEREAR